jgi:hypothetical protein
MLYRLSLHAQSLFTAAACLGRRDELVLPSGHSAADLGRLIEQKGLPERNPNTVELLLVWIELRRASARSPPGLMPY